MFCDLCRLCLTVCLIFTDLLSSVSSLEVHVDLLDLTDLTDVSDQELSEVFVELEDEDHNDSLSSECHYPNTTLISGLGKIINK